MKKKQTNRIVSLLLAVIMMLSIVPLATIETSAAGGVKTKLDSFMKSYPSGSRWTGSFDGGIQCYGFAKMAIYNVFGKSGGSYRHWKYDGTPTVGMQKIGSITSFSSSNVKSLLSKAKCGDILQFNTPKQHTMIVYAVESDGVRVYDCNWDNNCGISLRKSSFGAWSGRNSTKLTLLRADNYNTIDGASYKTGRYTITTQAGLRIRSTASTSGTQLGLIPYNTTVNVTKISGNWGYTTYNGVSGWICLDYTKYIGEIKKEYYVDVWASTKGQGYQANQCPAVSTGNAGMSYYIWFKIAEKTTDALYAENTNYTYKISINYPDGS